jgi:hypothetical protein
MDGIFIDWRIFLLLSEEIYKLKGMLELLPPLSVPSVRPLKN